MSSPSLPFLLRLSAAFACLLGLLALLQSAETAYVSRPDITPTEWNVSFFAEGAQDKLAPGFVFLAPRTLVPANLAIYSGIDGQLIWYSTPIAVTEGAGGAGAYDLHPQTYHGQPVMTYWAGTQNFGHGYGNIVVLAANYTVLANVSAPGQYGSDIHESRITKNNTLLSLQYNVTDGVDASNIMTGIEDSFVFDACIFEMDLPSGNVLFSWCASKNNVTADESFQNIPTTPAQDTPWDWMHANCVDKDDLGNYLLSLRHAHAIWYISGANNSILWRLGGMKSDFTGPGANFSWQHDAQWVQDEAASSLSTLQQSMQSGTRRLTIFDNASNGTIDNATQSRGMLVELDFVNRTATLLQEYSNPGNQTLLAASQGNTQFFNHAVEDDNALSPDSDNVLMGYGSIPAFAEYQRDGTPLQVVRWGEPGQQSYRAYKAPWVGNPSTKPVVAVDGNGTVFASWNGATEVHRWRIYVGNQSAHDYQGYLVHKNSFETAVRINVTAGKDVFVAALTDDGQELSRSAILSFNGTMATTWSPGYDGDFFNANSSSANATSSSSNATAVTASIVSTGTSTATSTSIVDNHTDGAAFASYNPTLMAYLITGTAVVGTAFWTISA